MSISNLLIIFSSSFMALFPVINPLGNGFVVNGFLIDLDPRQRKTAIQKLIFNYVLIGIGTLVIGHLFLLMFGLAIPVIQLGGGILICKTAVELLSDTDPTEKEESSQKIFFDGQIYDAFSLIVSLIQKADKEITLIDGYVDVGTLNLLSKKNKDVSVTIYTHKNTKLTKTDTENFNAQYPTVEVKYTKAFHDRFLILDRKISYHVGASLKDAGKKCFGISLIQDPGIIKDILQRLELEAKEC